MARYDRRLVRPSVHQVAEALTEASSGEFAFWHEIVERIRHVPEGFESWHEAGVVSLAWWTDAEQGRHFRIEGCTKDDPEYAFASMLRRTDRCPLWHLYPEYVVARVRDGRPDWLVLCDCGNGGSLGQCKWMGDRCHACHASPDPYTSRPPRGPFAAYAIEGTRATLLVYSGDHRLAAVAGAGPWVDLWDVASRSVLRRLETGPTPPRHVAFVRGVDTVAVAGQDRMLRFFDIATGEPRGWIPTPKDLRQVACAADGRLLVMVGKDNTEIWDRSTPQEPQQLVLDLCLSVEHAAISGGGRHVALATAASLLLLERSIRSIVPHWMARVPNVGFKRVAFRPDSQEVVAIRSATAFRYNHQNSFAEVATYPIGSSSPERVSNPLDWSDDAVLSPDGDWLVRLEGCAIQFVGLTAAKRRYIFTSDPRSTYTSLAFSPDRMTVATIDDRGSLQQWPWHRMRRE